MRRIIAGVLFVVLLTQSSGASALAASGTAAPSFAWIGVALASLTTPLHNAWLNSLPHAILAGQLDRYNAMHAPAPHIPRVPRNLVRTRLAAIQRLHPAARHGVIVPAPGFRRVHAVVPAKVSGDPLAMRASTVPGTAPVQPTATVAFARRFSHARFSTASRETTVISASMAPMTCPLGQGGGSDIVCCPGGVCSTKPPPPTPTPTPGPTATPSPTPIPSPTPTPTETPIATPCPVGDSGIPPDCIGTTPTPAPTPGLTPSTTGLTHYWAYEQHPVPGVGTAYVNVGNGNLVLPVIDFSIPERGVVLSFTRTYNSQSQHDSSGTDGSTPSVFGNGWTNNYDIHLAYNATYNVISVYDVDGARYDYTANGQGGWVAPPGQFAALTFDSTNCTYDWTQKDGSTYFFEPPLQVGGECSTIAAGYLGRLVAIGGRNSNNSVTLTYLWANGDASNPENLTEIQVAHSDGQQLILTFGPAYEGSGPTELSSIQRPDGLEDTYTYDQSGDLTSVTEPASEAGYCEGPHPHPYSVEGDWTCQNIAGVQAYDYASGAYSYLLRDVYSPNYVVSTGNVGADIMFCFDASQECQNAPQGRQTTGIVDSANVNFTPSDGMSAVLQSAYASGMQPFRYESFSGYGTGTIDVDDSDGHARIWTLDGLWRPAMLQECTNSCNGSGWLVSYAAWDANNDLVASTDVRDYETDYAYDASGNLVAMAAPSITTSAGEFRPTTLYSYDANNNVTAACDPVETNLLSENWSENVPTGDSLCPTGHSGVVTYAWNYDDEYEPYGQLSVITTANGYTYDVEYAIGPQQGDFGLPTEVAGAQITQDDTTQRTPQQSLSYDSYGNVVSEANGVGTASATYDDMNRITSMTDPDGEPTVVGYYPNGLLAGYETPSQVVQDESDSNTIATTYDYDLDGNQIMAYSYTGGYSGGSGSTSLATQSARTSYVYDGEDRLVEVIEPQDNLSFAPSGTPQTDDLYTNAWATRYLYDLSQDGNLTRPTFDGQPVMAHGNMYETQELLPPLSGETTVSETQSGPTPTPIANTQFQETKGIAYDALDRPTAMLRYEIGGSALEQQMMRYDVTPDSTGMLSSHCNALAICGTLKYDARGQAMSVTYSDGQTPSESFEYDPDGRTASIASSTFGTQAYAYDADGNVTYSQEPSGGGLTSPAGITYHYYADDLRASLDVSSSGLTQAGLFQYDYRTDGMLKQLVVQDSADSTVGTIDIDYTYDNAGLVQSRTESGGGGTPQSTVGCQNPCQTGLVPSMDETQYQYSNVSYNGQSSYQLSGIQYATDSASLPVTEWLSNIEWDWQGNILEEELNQKVGTSGSSTATRDATYEVDNNGRLTGMSRAVTEYYANGFGIPNMSSGGSETWDARNGVPTSSESGTFTFDAAGRLSQEVIAGRTMTATYDAENHLLGEDWSDIGLSSYQWGPDGLPIEIGSQQQDGSLALDTLHYDGGQLLFTTNAQGEVDDIKVGTIGDITPLDPGFTGLTLTDRDASGEAEACHNATGGAGNGVDAPWRGARYGLPELPAYTSACSMQGESAPGWSTAWTKYPTATLWTQEGTSDLFNSSLGVEQVGHGGVLGMPRMDGFTDGFTTFQGVRTFDGNLGTWMEPDAYGGNAATPASGQSFEYNSNNPLVYGDVNGYDDSQSPPPIDDPPPCQAGQNSFTDDCIPDCASEYNCSTACPGTDECAWLPGIEGVPYYMAPIDPSCGTCDGQQIHACCHVGPFKWTPVTNQDCSIYPATSASRGVCSTLPNGRQLNSIRGCLQATYVPGFGYLGGYLLNPFDPGEGAAEGFIGAHAFCIPAGELIN
jgi:YD repeat-containing protein